MSRDSAPSEDTQPAKRYAAVKARPWLLQRGRWLLTALILITTCTLTATVALFVNAIPVSAPLDSADHLTVSLIQAGALQRVSTSAETVGELLAERDIPLPNGSQLSHAADEPLREGMVVSITPAREVEIDDNGSPGTILTALESPLDILGLAGVSVSETDKIWVNGALADYAALPNWTVPARQIRIRRAPSPQCN